MIGLLAFLAACSGGSGNGSAGSLNPFNWFHGARTNAPGAPLTLAPRRGYGFAVDTRQLADQIVDLKIERTATGAIVRATAQMPFEGFYNGGLVLVASDRADTVNLQFRVRPPGRITRAGPAHLRQMTAGFILSNGQLRGLRRINVAGLRNSRSIRP